MFCSAGHCVRFVQVNPNRQCLCIYGLYGAIQMLLLLLNHQEFWSVLEMK